MKHLLIIGIFLFYGFLHADARPAAFHSKIVFVSKEKTRARINTLYRYKFVAFDSGGMKLVFSVIGLPAWLRFDPFENSITGKPVKTGQYAIHILAVNGTDTGKQYFMLTVFDTQTTNILCLGNSITNGTSIYNSYRRDLWQMLHDGRYNFDFIGSWSKHHMGGQFPDPDFDLDHEGHSGWSAADIFRAPAWDSARGNIDSWLKEYFPDIVLVELGTNDVFQCRPVRDIIKNFTELVKILRKKNNHVKIFFAEIPPLGPQWAQKKLCGNDTTYDQRIKELNRSILIFAKDQMTSISSVFAVDQYGGISAENQYDDIHPNLSGEKIMAERWYDAIHKYISKLTNKKFVGIGQGYKKANQ
jgi:acyl-CoA thioesterase I